MIGRRALLLGAAAAGSGLLAGCSSHVVRRSLARRLARRLSDLLGPAERYTVRLDGSQDTELVRGYARRVEIQGRRVFAKSQFLIESLHLTLEDLRYEGGEPYLVSVGHTALQIEFTDDAVNQYLRFYQARYDPSVRFDPDQVHVEITYSLLGTPTRIRGDGRFVIQDGRRLLFDAEKVDLSLLNRPGFGERFVEDRVNPLVDLSRIDFPARIESVQILKGRIRAYGTAAIPREIRE